MDDDFAQLRVEYADHDFTAAAAGEDPMVTFRDWFRAASTDPRIVEPNALSLATVAADGTPSNRMVLLKDIDVSRAAFRIFTNLASRKGREARRAGVAAACWWWPGSPGRQVRAVGRTTELDRATVDAYFRTRPLAARVSAVASHQSRAIADRRTLEDRVDLHADPVAAPADWGGIELIADEIEFWQGRTGRLHDRITFLRLAADAAQVMSSSAVEAAGGSSALLAAGAIVTDAGGTRWLRVRLEP